MSTSLNTAELRKTLQEGAREYLIVGFISLLTVCWLTRGEAAAANYRQILLLMPSPLRTLATCHLPPVVHSLVVPLSLVDCPFAVECELMPLGANRAYRKYRDMLLLRTPTLRLQMQPVSQAYDQADQDRA